MIGIDWGTTHLRAYRIAQDGAVMARRESDRGIMHVADGRFSDVLRDVAGDWIEAGEHHVLLAGMVGSRQGWLEARYLPCPAGAEAIGAALVAVPFEGAQVLLVPGLCDCDASGVPEVMRGEETEIIGVQDLLGGAGLACLPGTHTKWARIPEGRIAGFETYFSGEAFGALRSHTILGRMMVDGPILDVAFDRGLARSRQPGHLLHHLFGVRTLGLMDQLDQTESASYLSGLLIGHEVRAALPTGGRVVLIGSASLCALYARAIAACGGEAVAAPSDAAARGLARIGKAARWT
jgi:2-dehydro-3-deoxygalactonokinase